MLAFQVKRQSKPKVKPESDEKAGPSKPKSPPSPKPGTSGKGAKKSSSKDSEEDLQNVVSEVPRRYNVVVKSWVTLNSASILTSLLPKR